MRQTVIFFFFLFLSLFLVKTAMAMEDFDPNFIISDYEILDYNSMSLEEIQAFLESRGSYLANYKIFDSNAEIKKASEIIYNAATNNFDCEGVQLSSRVTLEEKKQKCRPFKTINPKFLLVLLQKEQGLIENSRPEIGRLNWAMGYGCPDGGGCYSRWKGFGKQVNSAALQFRDYMDNPQDYKYKVDHDYVFANPYASTVKAATNVNPTNKATAALYNYTPHVYNGNYNFWVIWNRYFRTTYPNGSLLQAKGEAGVWLIQDGKKRGFLSKTALTSRFNIKKILQVDKAVLAKYEIGVPIRFPQYSIIRDPNGKLWLLVDNKRRGFENEEAFRRIGFNPEEIMDASWEDVYSYVEGKIITKDSVYPTGALLQDDITGGVYWVEEGVKAPILEKIFLEVRFPGRKINPVSPEELARYPTIEPVKFNDGELVKINKAPGVYVTDQGRLRLIKSAEVFEAMGYKWDNIVTISPKVFLLYIKNQPIEVLGETEETIGENI